MMTPLDGFFVFVVVFFFLEGVADLVVFFGVVGAAVVAFGERSEPSGSTAEAAMAMLARSALRIEN
jgi:hypothetical protein